MSLTPNVQVRTGNRVSVSINSNKVGMCQSVRCSDNYNLQAASGIGDIHVAEWVPTQAIHQLTVQTMVLYPNALRKAAKATNSLPEAFEDDIMENGDAVLKGMTFEMSIEDSLTPSDTGSGSAGTGAGEGGKVFRVYKGCSFDSGDVDVTKHAIIVQNATFRATDVSNNPAQQQNTNVVNG